MNIKKFDVPTFDEWNKPKKNEGYDRDYQGVLGDFHFHIRAGSWSSDYTCYEMAIACRQNPLNIYSTPIFHRSYNHYSDYDVRSLEHWYQRTIIEAIEAFEKYIIETYINIEREE